jgi:DNA-binding NarL/FixJ family response regulator
VTVAATPRAVREISSLPGAVGLFSDDELVGKRLAAALAAADIAFVGPDREASALSAEASRRDLRLDVLIMRSEAGRVEHRQELRELQERLPDTAIVSIRSAAANEARRLLQAGVDGLVDESAIEQVLAATVTAVRCGQVCAPRRLRTQLDADELSAREKQVLGMVVMGFTNGEIARKLHLAESTVKSHLSTSFAKLGVRSRKEAAAVILDPEGGLGPGILTLSTH